MSAVANAHHHDNTNNALVMIVLINIKRANNVETGIQAVTCHELGLAEMLFTD